MKIPPTLCRQSLKKTASVVGRNRTVKCGFTLIELLVVIAIIAVLAGLLFPAMGMVRDRTKEVSAKNDAVQIVNAVRNYYTEYGKYPVATGAGTITNDNNTLFTILRAKEEADEETTPLNPRQIRFLEISRAKDLTSPKSGLDNQGNWVDPWGQEYIVVIDDDYDGSVNATTATFPGLAADEELDTAVIAGSLGKPNANRPVLTWK